MFSFTNILLVGSGGFVGSVCRYALGNLVHRMVSPALFPAGTLAVNVIGCLAIGALAGFADAQEGLNAQTRLFLLVGALGGFTTFSAFGLETFSLFRDGFEIRALVNIVVQVTVSLAAVAGGFMLSRGGLWS